MYPEKLMKEDIQAFLINSRTDGLANSSVMRHPHDRSVRRRKTRVHATCPKKQLPGKSISAYKKQSAHDERSLEAARKQASLKKLIREAAPQLERVTIHTITGEHSTFIGTAKSEKQARRNARRLARKQAILNSPFSVLDRNDYS